MTITGAIVEVMRRAGRPLTPAEAYEEINASGLYEFKAQKPCHVVRGQIRRRCEGVDFASAEPTKYFRKEPGGRSSPLADPVRVGPARGRSGKPTTGPRASDPKTISATLRELKRLQDLYLRQLRGRMLKELKGLSPTEFEHYARKLMEVYGFEEMRVTKPSGDGGIDGHGKLKVGLAHLDVAFQCKRWRKSNVPGDEIQKFRGQTQGKFQYGVFFTTAKFVRGAERLTVQPGAVPIVLVDGNGMVDLMIRRRFGVQEEVLEVPTYAFDGILEAGWE